jgi:hypothetical protein
LLRWSIAVMLVVALVACGEDSLTPDAVNGTPSEVASPGLEDDDMPDHSDRVNRAIADLATSTGADPAVIVVVSEEGVTWRDGSLGCPQPGMVYTQALVGGYRIVLRVHGKEVTYHGRTGKPPFRCDNPNPAGAVD